MKLSVLFVVNFVNIYVRSWPASLCSSYELTTCPVFFLLRLLRRRPSWPARPCNFVDFLWSRALGRRQGRAPPSFTDLLAAWPCRSRTTAQPSCPESLWSCRLPGRALVTPPRSCAGPSWRRRAAASWLVCSPGGSWRRQGSPQSIERSSR